MCRFESLPTVPSLPSGLSGCSFVVKLCPYSYCLETIDLFSVPRVLPFLECHIDRIPYRVDSGFFSLSRMHLKSICIVSCYQHTCFLKTCLEQLLNQTLIRREVYQEIEFRQDLYSPGIFKYDLIWK